MRSANQPSPAAAKQQKVLAVSSGGGHWVQLLRLYPGFAHHNTTFVTVREDYRSDVPEGCDLRVVRDATRWNKIQLLIMSLQLVIIMVRLRPDVVISTGAAPGVIALNIARLLGARTIWVDSIANCEELSLSGRQVARAAHLRLTQWEHLAASDGPRYAGSIA